MFIFIIYTVFTIFCFLWFLFTTRINLSSVERDRIPGCFSSRQTFRGPPKRHKEASFSDTLCQPTTREQTELTGVIALKSCWRFSRQQIYSLVVVLTIRLLKHLSKNLLGIREIKLLMLDNSLFYNVSLGYTYYFPQTFFFFYFAQLK